MHDFVSANRYGYDTVSNGSTNASSTQFEFRYRFVTTCFGDVLTVPDSLRKGANAIGDAVPRERDDGSRLQPPRRLLARRAPSSPQPRKASSSEAATHADETMQKRQSDGKTSPYGARKAAPWPHDARRERGAKPKAVAALGHILVASALPCLPCHACRSSRVCCSALAVAREGRTVKQWHAIVNFSDRPLSDDRSTTAHHEHGGRCTI